MTAAEQPSLLMDAPALVRELGVAKTTAEKIIREIARDTGVVAPASIRKVWVRREDVDAWLAANTRRIA